MNSSAPRTASPSATIDQLLAVAKQRLRELEPVAAEIAQLQRVITVLSAPGADAQLAELSALLNASAHLPAVALVPDVVVAAADSEATASSRRLSPKRGRDGRAPQGANKALILRTVKANPGIRPAAIAELTGLKPTVVSATVNRLKRQGQLEPEGRGVRVHAAAGRPVAAA